MANESIRLILYNDVSSIICNCMLHSLFDSLVWREDEGDEVEDEDGDEEGGEGGEFKYDQERNAWDISKPKEGRAKPLALSFAVLNVCNNA